MLSDKVPLPQSMAAEFYEISKSRSILVDLTGALGSGESINSLPRLRSMERRDHLISSGFYDCEAETLFSSRGFGVIYFVT